MSSLKEKRMKLTDEEIKGIMSRFNVLPVLETEKAIVFPTCCHNEIGGSHKLYYYKEDKIFKCFTECNALFDIFDLVQKVDKLRGGRMNLPEAIEFVGFKNDEKTYKENEDLIYLRKLTQSTDSLETDEDSDKIEILDAKIMDRFTFNIEGLSPWISEGIGIDALKKFSIRYDITKNAIIIPHWNEKGEIVGVRGRFFNENAKAKYMPLLYNGRTLSHPTGKYLYGYHINIAKIKQTGMAIIFEGEKSVLKMETLLPNNNVSLATSGKKITFNQINSLLGMGINEVVLAYDKDYTNETEQKEKIKEYSKIVSVLKPYFNISIIIDTKNKLKYKDSPIDQGLDIFLELMRDRMRQ